MRRVRSVSLALVAALSIAAVPVAADHSWGGYHWARTTRSFTLQLGDNSTTADWSRLLRASSGDWSSSRVLDTAVTAGTSNEAQACRPTLGKVEVCNGMYGEQLWVGIAQVWLDPNGHIVQGTVRNNDSFLQNPKWPRYNTEAARRYVMCQELGHTFGLDHQDANFNNASLGTCMDYTRDMENNTTPNRHDYEQLADDYAAVDGYSTVAASGAAVAGEFSPTKSQKGLIRYVTDLGGGYKLATLIIWPN